KRSMCERPASRWSCPARTLPRSSKPRVFSSDTKTAALGRLFCLDNFSGRCAKPLTRMARETGLEPATSAVTGRRSNQLSYSRGCSQEPRSEEGLKGPPFQVKQLAEARMNGGFLRCRCKKCPVFRTNRHSSLQPNRLRPEMSEVSMPFLKQIRRVKHG